MRNLRMILMSIMTMFMITNVNSQNENIMWDFDSITVFQDGVEISGTISPYSPQVKNYGSNGFRISIDSDIMTVYGNGYKHTIKYNTGDDDVVYKVLIDNVLSEITSSNGEVSIDIAKSFEGDVKMSKVGTTGINKNDISNDFNVYTYNNNLIVKTDDYNTQYEVSVHNMNGQMVMSEKNNGGMETYLQVPNGIYIINLITEDGGRLTKKVSIR